MATNPRHEASRAKVSERRPTKPVGLALPNHVWLEMRLQPERIDIAALGMASGSHLIRFDIEFVRPLEHTADPAPNTFQGENSDNKR
jgi:hypothetical protein